MDVLFKLTFMCVQMHITYVVKIRFSKNNVVYIFFKVENITSYILVCYIHPDYVLIDSMLSPARRHMTYFCILQALN